MDEANGYMGIRENEESILLKSSSSGQLLGLKHPKWCQVILFNSCLLVGQPAATLLTSFYYNNGGNNIWIATIVQSAGFPILIPVFLLRKFKNTSNIHSDDPPRNTPSNIKWSILLYLFFGIGFALVNVLYSYGLLCLPVSTFSLICASLLAFNAISNSIINCQKFTFFIFLSIFLLTASASLLAVDPDSDDSHETAKEESPYIIGIGITVAASALNSLISSLLERAFKDVLNKPPFEAALEILFYQCIVTTCLTVSGLFVLGEWKTVPDEMWNFDKGWVAYVIALFFISVSYQIAFFGQFGLTFVVSWLFANMVYTFSLPIVPVLGVVIFHDKVDVVKVIALGLAIGGSLSYIYNLYLDDVNSRDSSDSCEDLSA